MAKKSTATRQANAARRSQTTAKAPGVTLVRQSGQSKAGEDAVTAASNSTTNTNTNTTTNTAKSASATATAPAASATRPARTTVVATSTRPRAPEVNRPSTAKSAAPKTENTTRPASPATAKGQQANRIARAKATQRARSASLVSPEHYAYVKNDLKLIATLAISMFAIIIILHFVIPH